MVKLDSFIREELNSHVKDMILIAIRDGRKAQKHMEELVFNKYSLEIAFSENRITIYDDVFAEDIPLKLCLDEFLDMITKK